MKNIEEMAQALSQFFNENIDMEFFQEGIKSLMELEEYDGLAQLRIQYPNLCKRKCNLREWEHYIKSTYLTLRESSLCPFKG